MHFQAAFTDVNHRQVNCGHLFLSTLGLTKGEKIE